MEYRAPGRILVADGPEQRTGRALSSARPDLEFRIRHPKEMSAADLDWAEAYVGFRPPQHLAFDAASLRWVHSTGTGVDAFLFQARLPTGALLTHTLGDFGPRIAEYCLSRALFEAQRIPELLAAQGERRWSRIEAEELRGREILVVGTGRIGSHVARLFAALGCPVRGISRSGEPREPFVEVSRVEFLEEGFQRANLIVLVLPLTRETYQLVGERVLMAARGAFLINVGRGRVVDESALVRALQAGCLRGAALDVFVHEPLPPDSPLWTMPGVWVSPHLAARTLPEEIVEAFLVCHAALERGERPALAVDPGRGY